MASKISTYLSSAAPYAAGAVLAGWRIFGENKRNLSRIFGDYSVASTGCMIAQDFLKYDRLDWGRFVTLTGVGILIDKGVHHFVVNKLHKLPVWQSASLITTLGLFFIAAANTFRVDNSKESSSSAGNSYSSSSYNSIPDSSSASSASSGPSKEPKDGPSAYQMVSKFMRRTWNALNPLSGEGVVDSLKPDAAFGIWLGRCLVSSALGLGLQSVIQQAAKADFVKNLLWSGRN